MKRCSSRSDDVRHGHPAGERDRRVARRQPAAQRRSAPGPPPSSRSTISVTSASAASVSSHRAHSRNRSMRVRRGLARARRRRRGSRWRRQSTAAISTAPAAMSLASLASGSNAVVATSIACSTAELIIFGDQHERDRKHERDQLEPRRRRPTPRATSTTIAAAKCSRMFRCVRSTWTMPSIAKLKLSIERADVRLARLTRTPLPALPSRSVPVSEQV